MSSFETRITRAERLTPEQGQVSECLVQIYGDDLGRRYELVSTAIIGRGEECDIVLEVDSVSRRHALLERNAGGIRLKDLDSTNGSYVNDKLVGETTLRHGDLIKVGSTIFKFLAGGEIENAYYEEIYRMTIMDGLTRIYNRRYLEEFLERELARAHRYNRPLSVVLLDLDHFKNINDEYGHLAGDFVLQQFAELVRGRIRREEVFARYGGEEFCIALPETTAKGALGVAEKLRVLVEDHRFKFDGDVIPVTLSAGIAGVQAGMDTWPALAQAADKQLYRAKSAGRNRVCGESDA